MTAYFDVDSQGQVLGNLTGRLVGTGVSKSQPIVLTKEFSTYTFVLHIPSVRCAHSCLAVIYQAF